MADDIAITAGAGTTVATDDCSGRHVQIFKQAVSADGSAALVPADATDGSLVNLGANNDVVATGPSAHDAPLSGNPVLVGGYASAAAPTDVSDADAVRAWLLRNGSQVVAISAAGTLISGDATNGLDVDVTRLPALVAGTANIGDVDVLTVPPPLSTTGGGTETTALRVTLANDSTGVVSIDDNGGTITVDGSVAIGAIAAGDNNIGNVDVVTLPSLAAGTNNIGDVDVLTVNGVAPAFGSGARGATVQRVTVATDDVVPVTDNGGSLTVDAPVGTPAFVRLSDGAAAITTLPVSLASVPSHAVTNAGTFATQAAGDTAHDVVDAGNPVKIGGKTVAAVPTPVAAADRVDAWFDLYGRQVVCDRDTEMGNEQGRTSLRDNLVAQRCTVLADSLADGLAGFWTSTTSNGGTATSSGGEGLIQTTASSAGTAQISSTVVTYFPGMVAWFNNAVRFNDTGSAGNIRRIGVFTVSGTTPQNGFYFELSGTTLNAVVCNAGTPTAVASTSWTRFATDPFTLDTNYHSFEIRYTANTAMFYVDNILRHTVSGTTAAITATLNFPMTVQSLNTSGATNRLIAVRNIGVGRFGSPVQTVDETGLSAVRAVAVGGGTPHDSVDSGNPVKVGAKAVAHGTNPTAVAAGDRTDLYSNRAGVPFVIGGHPNAVTSTTRIPAATGAQTDAAIGPGAVGAGLKVVVTRIAVTCSNANTVNVAVKVGFGAATLPADSTTGAAGVLMDHEGVPPGGGFVIGNGAGILGVGADGEELRWTCDSPTSGFVIVSVTYFTIES